MWTSWISPNRSRQSLLADPSILHASLGGAILLASSWISGHQPDHAGRSARRRNRRGGHQLRWSSIRAAVERRAAQPGGQRYRVARSRGARQEEAGGRRSRRPTRTPFRIQSKDNDKRRSSTRDRDGARRTVGAQQQQDHANQMYSTGGTKSVRPLCHMQGGAAWRSATIRPSAPSSAPMPRSCATGWRRTGRPPNRFAPIHPGRGRCDVHHPPRRACVRLGIRITERSGNRRSGYFRAARHYGRCAVLPSSRRSFRRTRRRSNCDFNLKQ